MLPKTPEAALLHFIDNIDARMEMFFTAYAAAGKQSPGDRIRPLGIVPFPPLPVHATANVEDPAKVPAGNEMPDQADLLL